MKFGEDSRVKIPALLHLTRLGYRYLSLRDSRWDTSSNIFPTVFKGSLQQINPTATTEDIERTFQEISLLLDNEDLGKAFYERLISPSGIKLVDFANFDANSFHVVTELPCIKDDEEFRPDITLLINGLPLVFIEVKKPNNRDGILAERNRINSRFRNPKFRRFVNITQLVMFSNNMEYDDGSHEPLQGAFYATTAHEKPEFNYFREETPSALPPLPPLDEATETLILSDNNLHALKHAPEYATIFALFAFSAANCLIPAFPCPVSAPIRAIRGQSISNETIATKNMTAPTSHLCVLCGQIVWSCPRRPTAILAQSSPSWPTIIRRRTGSSKYLVDLIASPNPFAGIAKAYCEPGHSDQLTSPNRHVRPRDQRT